MLDRLRCLLVAICLATLLWLFAMSRTSTRLDPLNSERTEPAASWTATTEPREVEVPLRFLCPADFPQQPRLCGTGAPTVKVRVRGPVCVNPPRVLAYIDLTRGLRSAGVQRQAVCLQLPQGYQLDQELPTVTFELLPVEPAASFARWSNPEP
jgi:hypothetical protein